MTVAERLEAAQAATRDGRLAEALESVNGILAAEPGHVGARVLLTQVLDRSGQPGQAAKVVDGLLRDAPDNPQFLHWHSVLFTKAGESAIALPSAERLAKLQPDHAEAQANLGVVLGSLGRHEEAAAAFGRAAGLNPASPFYRFNQAYATIQLGQDETAQPILEDLLLMARDFVPGRLALGELHLRRGDLDAAIAEARLAVRAQPDNIRGHLLLVRGLTERSANEGVGRDEAEAEKHIRLALELEPDSFVAHGMLGFALQEKGDFEGAAPEFEASIRLNPRQGPAYYGLATCGSYGRADTRVALVQSALDQSDLAAKDEAYIHYALGKMLEDQRRYREALEQFDAANTIMYEELSQVRPFDARSHEDRASWVIESFSETFIQRSRGVGSTSSLPLIIVGLIRSGTTLVEQILSTHPQVAGSGELVFWHNNAGRATVSGVHRLDPASVTSIADGYLGLLERIGPGAARVTDKLPENYLYLGLIHTIFPEARIIHCRRHPVDTCLSIYGTPWTSPPDFVFSRANIVFAYRQYLRLMAHWRRVIPPDRLLEVDYEDLVADREAVSRRMIEFAGLAWDDACLHHERNVRPVKTLSRWQVRQPIYKSSVGRWKNFEPWLGEFADLLQ